MNDINLVKTDRFKKIKMSISFILPFKKEYIIYSNLLSSMLLNTSMKYKTRKEIRDELDYLYGSVISTKQTVYGNLFINEFILSFITPKYTEENMYEKTFNIFEELLFNPNVKENKFNEKEFNINKQNIIKNIESLKEINYISASSEYNKIMFKNTPYEYTPLSLINKYKEVTNEEIYKFYKTLILDSNFKIVVVGNFEEDIVCKYLSKIKCKLTKHIHKLPQIILKDTKVDKIKTKHIKRDSFQSDLLVGYILNNLTKREREYVLPIYNIILGGMNNSVLFVNVREEKSLCYSIFSYIHKVVPALTIESGINKYKYNEAMDAIKKSVSLMNNKENITNLFKNAINTLNMSLNDFYDDIEKIRNYQIYKEIYGLKSIEKRRSEFNSVTVDEVLSLNKKLCLSTIFFQEGKREKD